MDGVENVLSESTREREREREREILFIVHLLWQCKCLRERVSCFIRCLMSCDGGD